MSLQKEISTLVVWDPLDILIQDLDYGSPPKLGAPAFVSKSEALLPLRLIAQNFPNVGQCLATSLPQYMLVRWVFENKLGGIFCRIFCQEDGMPRQQMELAMSNLHPSRLLYITSTQKNLAVLRPEQIRERNASVQWKEGNFATALYAPHECQSDFRDAYHYGRMMKNFLAGADVVIRSTNEVYYILKDGFKENISE